MREGVPGSLGVVHSLTLFPECGRLVRLRGEGLVQGHLTATARAETVRFSALKAGDTSRGRVAVGARERRVWGL